MLHACRNENPTPGTGRHRRLVSQITVVIDAVRSRPILSPAVEGLAEGFRVKSDRRNWHQKCQRGKCGKQERFGSRSFHGSERVTGKGIPAPGSEIIISDDIC